MKITSGFQIKENIMHQPGEKKILELQGKPCSSSLILQQNSHYRSSVNHEFVSRLLAYAYRQKCPVDWILQEDELLFYTEKFTKMVCEMPC